VSPGDWSRLRLLEIVSIGTTAAAFALTVVLVSTGRATELNPWGQWFLGLLDWSVVAWSIAGVLGIAVEALAYRYLERHRDEGNHSVSIRGREFATVDVSRLVFCGGVFVALVGVLDLLVNLALLSSVEVSIAHIHVEKYWLPIGAVLVAGVVAINRSTVWTIVLEVTDLVDLPDGRPDRLGFRVAVVFFAATVLLSGVTPFVQTESVQNASAATTHTLDWQDTTVDGDVHSIEQDDTNEIVVGVSGNDNQFYAYKVADGTRLFNTSIPTDFYSNTLRIDEDDRMAIWYDNANDQIQIGDTTDGSLIREFSANDTNAGEHALAYDETNNLIYFFYENTSDSNIHLSEYDANTGDRVNDVQIKSGGAGANWVARYDGDYSDTLYFGTDSYYRGIDTSTYSETFNVSADIDDIAVGDGKTFVFNRSSTELEAYDSSGNLEWSANTGSNGDAVGITSAKDAIVSGDYGYWANGTQIWSDGTHGAGTTVGRNESGNLYYAHSSNSGVEKYDTSTAVEGQSPDIRGQVKDQSGAAVSGATVELWLMDDANTTTDAGESVEEAQEETIETISRTVPRDLYDPDVDLVAGQEYAHSAEKQVLVHPKSAWFEEAEPIGGYEPTVGTAGTMDLGTPLIQLQPNTPYAASIWDRTRDPVLEDGVDQKLDPGVSDSGTIVVEQIGPANDTADRFTAQTVEKVRTGFGGVAKTHEYTELSLPEGYYRLRAQNGTAVTILRVGSPEEIPRQIRPELENAENQTAAIASEVQDKLDNGEMKRVTVQTNETGHFNYSSVPSGTSTVAITVFDGQGLTEGITDPTLSDLQTQIERQDYNGSIYLSTSPEIVNPPDRNVSITVTEVHNPTLGDLQTYFDKLAWVEDLVNEEAFAELSHLFTEPLENTDRADILDSRDRLRDTILANSDMKAAWEEIASERGIETDLFASDLSKEELKEQVEALLLATSRAQDTIDTEDTTVDTSPFDGGGTNVNVNVDLGERINDTANATNVVCQQPDGATRWVNQSNVSVDNGLSSSTVLIEEVLDNQTAGCNYIVTAPGEDGGTARETINVENPAFDGTIPELASINFNTQRPGPSEEVRVDVTPTETSSYESLEGATVYDPDGNELNTTLSDGVASFRTNGSGSHLIKLNVSDGERGYVETVRVKAGKESINYPASVRVHNGVLGRTAIASDGVEEARVTISNGGSAARITAAVDPEDVPGLTHVHVTELTGSVQEVTVPLA
jgi:hypothetical protein